MGTVLRMTKLKEIALLAAFLFVSALPAPVFAGNTTSEQSSSNAATTVSSTVTNIIVARSAPGGGGGGGGELTSLTSPTGMSAGDNAQGIGVWAVGGATFLDHSKPGTKYNGNLGISMVGVDKLFGSLLLGVGLGYERLDLSTPYNGGGIAYDGFSIIPYLSYSITPDLVADASLIFAWLDYTMKDTEAGVKYRDHMPADRRVVSAGLTQYLSFDKLLLSGRLGTMYMNEHQGAYVLNTTANSKSGIYNWQGAASVRGTYDMGVFKPFLGTTFTRDLMKSGKPSNDDWGSDYELGFTYNFTDTFQMGLTGTYGFRENLTKGGALLNVRYDF